MENTRLQSTKRDREELRLRITKDFRTTRTTPRPEHLPLRVMEDPAPAHVVDTLKAVLQTTSQQLDHGEAVARFAVAWVLSHHYPNDAARHIVELVGDGRSQDQLLAVAQLIGYPTPLYFNTKTLPDSAILPGHTLTLGKSREAIQNMRHIKDAFRDGCRLHNAPTGFRLFRNLLTAYLVACETALDRGLPFDGVESHSRSFFPSDVAQSEWVADKLRHIFGNAFADNTELADVFTRYLAVGQPTGRPKPVTMPTIENATIKPDRFCAVTVKLDGLIGKPEFGMVLGHQRDIAFPMPFGDQAHSSDSTNGLGMGEYLRWSDAYTMAFQKLRASRPGPREGGNVYDAKTLGEYVTRTSADIIARFVASAPDPAVASETIAHTMTTHDPFLVAWSLMEARAMPGERVRYIKQSSSLAGHYAMVREDAGAVLIQFEDAEGLLTGEVHSVIRSNLAPAPSSSKRWDPETSLAEPKEVAGFRAGLRLTPAEAELEAKKPDALHQPRTAPMQFVDMDGNPRKMSDVDPQLNATQRALIDALEGGPARLQGFSPSDIAKLQDDGWIVSMICIKDPHTHWTTDPKYLIPSNRAAFGYGLKSMVLKGKIQAVDRTIRFADLTFAPFTPAPDVETLAEFPKSVETMPWERPALPHGVAARTVMHARSFYRNPDDGRAWYLSSKLVWWLVNSPTMPPGVVAISCKAPTDQEASNIVRCATDPKNEVLVFNLDLVAPGAIGEMLRGSSWTESKMTRSGLHPSLVWVPVKVGDEVRVTSGAFKGRTGKVEQADPAFNGNVRCVFCTNEHGVGAFTTEQRNLVKVEAKAPTLSDAELNKHASNYMATFAERGPYGIPRDTYDIERALQGERPLTVEEVRAAHPEVAPIEKPTLIDHGRALIFKLADIIDPVGPDDVDEIDRAIEEARRSDLEASFGVSNRFDTKHAKRAKAFIRSLLGRE